MLHRLVLSDALTLTNRLKRQHLTGDVGHLSRTTVGTIVSEATLLRSNFRSLLEDDKIITVCTRKDLRALFNLLRDAFNELGELRTTLNDVILDPSLAQKISEAAMNPSKVLAEKENAGGPAGWIAPIVKLFQGGEEKPIPSSSSNPSSHAGLLRSTTQRPTSRIVPKLSPALSASTTTINVEFQSGSAGRAITSTHSAHPSSSEAVNRGGQQPEDDMKAKTNASVMGIFAGAPKPSSPQDPWIVIPKQSRKQPSPLSRFGDHETREGSETGGVRPAPGSGTLTIGRNTLKVNAQLSRVVDAVIDVQSPTVAATPSDYQATLLHRGLRPRGRSESSIHTTFLNHAEDQSGPSDEQQVVGEQTDQTPTSSGILASFGKKMFGLRNVSSSFGPLSRGVAPKPPTHTLPSTSTSNLVTADLSAGNTSLVPPRMRPSVSSGSRVQEESDEEDLGSSGTSRGHFFPIAGTRVNVDSWSGNEPYVGSMRQEWMTSRDRGLDY